MSKLAEQTGIQSYCFRHFKDNAQVAQMIRQCGADRVELCGVHIDFNQPDTFEAVIKAYRDNGVAIASIGVEGFRNDATKEKLRFDFCRLAGAKVISCDFDPATAPACYRVVEKLAEQYDLRLAIHNHGGRHWLGSAAMIDHVLKNTSERIGLCLDTAWALDSGEDPLAMVDKFAKRLYGIHYKDFVFDPARRPQDVIIGQGNLDLAKLVRQVSAGGFQGSAVLEYEGDVENPVPALSQCVAALHRVA